LIEEEFMDNTDEELLMSMLQSEQQSEVLLGLGEEEK
jgi:hypothetical protein